MKERFGVEIETISKKDCPTVSRIIAGVVGIEKTDTINHYHHSPHGGKWAVESDGSIRRTDSHPYDCEIITRPLQIQDMSEIQRVLDSLKGEISTNQSCGLHVHIECPDAATLKNVLLIWRKLEGQIIGMFPESRRSNRYCQRLAGMRTDTMLGLHFGRYHMVNPESYAIRGTVEFRGHSSTTDYRKIKRWVFVCAAIVRVAKSFVGREEELAHILGRRRVDVAEFLGLEKKTANYVAARIRHFEKLGIAGEVEACVV